MNDVTHPKVIELEGLTARALVAVAVRAAQRSLLRHPPLVQLKRHQKMVDDLHRGLALAGEFVGGAECTLPFLRKLVFASGRVAAVADDMRYGPNQLELHCGEVSPVESISDAVAAAVRAAMSALEQQMTGASDFAGVESFAADAVRRGVYDPQDLDVARHIGQGRPTELGPALDLSNGGPFGPIV